MEKINEKLNDIIKEPEVRFVGIINMEGELLLGKFRPDIIPLENEEQRKMIYRELVARVATRKKFDSSMGRVKYSASRREKVVMMSFPLNELVLMITADPYVNVDRLAYNIIKKLGSDWDQFFGK